MSENSNPYFDGDFTHIGGLIKNSLRTCMPEAGVNFIRIREIWNDTVGNMMANDAQPAALKNGQLIVYVTSSSWIYHLQFLKNEFIQKLNSRLGRAAVKDIIFKVGSVG